MWGGSSRVRARLWTVAGAAALVVAGCGGAGHAHDGSPTNSAATAATASQPTTSVTTSRTTTPKPRPKPKPPRPRLLGAAARQGVTDLVPAVTWGGRTAAWLGRTASGVTLMAFDQKLVALHLHAGTIDPGVGDWTYGPDVQGAELKRLVAAFNGGFRLAVGAGGFVDDGRTVVPLTDGLGSIVTYSDGYTDIGAWHHGVPAAGKRVVSVRQNLSLLVSGGQPAGNLDCIICWGATLGGVPAPARSALGITADGRLVWAGGENLLPGTLAQALIGAHVVRAVELDINPEWVAGYFYGHPAAHRPPVPVPVVPGQLGIPGQFLAPWGRDFFTIVAR